MTDVRLATLDDLPVIRAIYNHYVRTSTCTFQVEQETEQERLQWFTQRSGDHPVTVAEVAGTVAGWASLSPWKSRCAYARTAEVSVYVHHDHHRQGVGRALLADLIERARVIGHRTLIGGTCTEQEASVALQQSLGFTQAGLLRQVGNKFGRWLDVMYMQLILGADTDR